MWVTEGIHEYFNGSSVVKVCWKPLEGIQGSSSRILGSKTFTIDLFGHIFLELHKEFENDMDHTES